MFGHIIKTLYIGKSKLPIFCNNKNIPGEREVQDILQPTGYSGRMPDYGTYGNLVNGEFHITPMMPKHALYITGIPKGDILDNYRLKKTHWSSYYEDDYRGYLFQVTDDYSPKLLIPE